MTNIYPFDWPTNGSCQAEVVVKTVYSIQKTRQALDLVQERKTVVLILDKLLLDQAQELADWVAGEAVPLMDEPFGLGRGL
jgi:cell division inhibitor SepF